MSTQEQTTANRKNAQASTGPKTAEGKATSSQNGVKHGLFAKNDVISGEDLAFYEAHRQDIYEEFAPMTPTESVLTQRIASLTWRLMRADRLQTTTINTLVAAQQRAAPLEAPPEELKIDAMVKALRMKDKDPEYALTTAGIILAGLARFDREPFYSDPAVDKAICDAMNPPVDNHICDAEIQLGTVIYNDFNGPAVLDRLLGYEQRMQSLLFKTIRQIQQIQDNRIKNDAARDRRAMQYMRQEDEAERDRKEYEYQQRINKTYPDPDAPDGPEPEPLNVLQEYELRKMGRLPKPQNEPNIPVTSITEMTYNRSRYAKERGSNPFDPGRPTKD